MKGFGLLLSALSLTGCAKLQEFTEPQPHHLLAHADWFDQRDVSVCGTVRHGQGTCFLDVCLDGAASCARPVPVWISTATLSCYSAATTTIDTARVEGQFLSLKDNTSFVLAGAKVSFVKDCAAP